MHEVIVIGAGLAGCEASWQLANRGIRVHLWEMKPQKYTPAHSSPSFAELVCSNSLRSDELTNAVGLLKEEMRERANAGATVFFSIHVLEVAEKLYDRVGIIHKGKLIMEGTPEELLGKTGDASLEEVFLEMTASAQENA